ncbi:MAG: O-antigen ligase family protein [Pseudomonadota bacterium]|nr:O-antigen ligase family protein [Pseudomonadota bacterium]
MQRSISDAEKHQRLLFLALTVHVYLEYTRLPSVFTFLGPLQLSALSMYLLVALWIFKGNKAVLRDNCSRMALAFLVLMAIHVPIARNNFYAYQMTTTTAWLVFGLAFPLASIIDSEQRLARFVHHWILIHGFICIYVMTHAGQGTGGFLEDENDVSLALLAGLPYAFYLSVAPGISSGRKWLYRLVVLLCLAGVVASKSRGGFVGLLAVVGVMWWLSEKKFRNLAIALGLSAVAGAAVVSVLPSGYTEDMASISDEGDGTRRERLYSWGIGWRMFLDNPVLGVGPGNYAWSVAHYEMQMTPEERKGHKSVAGRVSHSLYFTLIPELGVVGVALYFGMIFSTVSRLRRIHRQPKTRAGPAGRRTDLTALMARAALVSLVAYLSAGAFITVIYYPHFWFYIGFALAVINIAARQVAAAPLEGAGGNTLGRRT